MKANREWLSISDMMAGLMMVFLFIAVVFMQKVNQDKESMVEIANAYAESKSSLNLALHSEFDKDLDGWGAEILIDNTIRFKNPDVLFARSSSKIKNKFQSILDDFFPRYLLILTDEQFKDDIIEIRVEGHTSSLWRKNSTVQEAYLNNARLSQDRAFSVLSYLYKLPAVEQHHEWLIQVFRANGLAFSNRIFDGGVEDLERSRRVEFKVVTNAQERIEQIILKAN